MGDQRRVLIVDNDEFVRRALTRVFRTAGLPVTAVESAAAAADRLRGSTDVAVLLTDFDMPGMTGMDLAEWVRREVKAPVLIIGMTGDALRLCRMQEAECFDHAFLKPFERFKEVLDLISGACLE
jgi:CheY-like chemotaxis protein